MGKEENGLFISSNSYFLASFMPYTLYFLFPMINTFYFLVRGSLSSSCLSIHPHHSFHSVSLSLSLFCRTVLILHDPSTDICLPYNFHVILLIHFLSFSCRAGITSASFRCWFISDILNQTSQSQIVLLKHTHTRICLFRLTCCFSTRLQCFAVFRLVKWNTINGS